MTSRSHDECQPGHAVHPPNAHLPTPADQDPTGADQRSRSPLFKVDQIRVPVLIAQGANDPRVPQAESEQIVAALKANGTPYEYVLFPDEGHGFAKPETGCASTRLRSAFSQLTWVVAIRQTRGTSDR